MSDWGKLINSTIGEFIKSYKSPPGLSDLIARMPERRPTLLEGTWPEMPKTAQKDTANHRYKVVSTYIDDGGQVRSNTLYFRTAKDWLACVKKSWRIGRIRTSVIDVRVYRWGNAGYRLIPKSKQPSLPK